MSESEKQAILGKMAKDALTVQDACNLSGVVISFARVVPELRSLLGSWDVSEHPIVQLWASKIHDMCGMGASSTAKYAHAYQMTLILAGGWPD